MKTTIMTPTIRLWLSALIIGATGMLSAPAMAQNEGRWYQVEILVFKRNNPVETGEIWQQNTELRYPSNTRNITGTVNRNRHNLDGFNYVLRRDEAHTVLFHQAWKQQMWGKARSPALIVRGGQDFGSHKELEGTITIHIGRYLHVTTDLWLSRYDGLALNQTAIPLPTNNRENTPDYLSSPAIPSQLAVFKETRRMRSKETHYIDHPLMGIMVRMLPL